MANMSAADQQEYKDAMDARLAAVEKAMKDDSLTFNQKRELMAKCALFRSCGFAASSTIQVPCRLHERLVPPQ